jgi:hypothetical protein
MLSALCLALGLSIQNSKLTSSEALYLAEDQISEEKNLVKIRFPMQMTHLGFAVAPPLLTDE